MAGTRYTLKKELTIFAISLDVSDGGGGLQGERQAEQNKVVKNGSKVFGLGTRIQLLFIAKQQQFGRWEEDQELIFDTHLNGAVE